MGGGNTGVGAMAGISATACADMGKANKKPCAIARKGRRKA